MNGCAVLRDKRQLYNNVDYAAGTVVQRFNFVDETLVCNNSDSGSTLHLNRPV